MSELKQQNLLPQPRPQEPPLEEPSATEHPGRMSKSCGNWAGRWRSQHPAQTLEDGGTRVGVRIQEGRCLALVLSQFPLIVYLGFVLWRKMLTMVVGGLRKEADFSLHTDFRNPEAGGAAGFLNLAWKVTCEGVACSHSVRSFVSGAVLNNQIDLVNLVFERRSQLPTAWQVALTGPKLHLLHTCAGCGTRCAHPSSLGLAPRHDSKARMGQLLLKHLGTASIDQANSSSYSALTCAIHHDQTELVRVFVTQGRAKIPPEALLWARSAEMVKLLLEFGVDPLSLTGTNYSKTTPLLNAILHERLDVIRALLTLAQVGVNLSNGAEAPLAYAVIHRSFPAVKLLLELGADPNNSLLLFLLAPKYCQRNESTLQLAKLLLQHGVSIHERLESGLTPLHEAAKRDNRNMVKFLIAHGADVEARDAEQRTPLHLAVDRSAVDAVRELLEQGNADRSAQDKDGLTPHDLAKELTGYTTKDKNTISALVDPTKGKKNKKKKQGSKR